MRGAEDRSESSLTGIKVLGEIAPGFEAILTPEALRFIAKLQRVFGAERESLLKRRREVQTEIDSGEFPTLIKAADSPRNDPEWRVGPVPSELQDRRVEITGPVDRKMMINALNSGARVFMADFEDSHSPTWVNTIQGQVNLFDAVRRSISYTSPEGKSYSLNEKTAVLMVRPRGWHLLEKHVSVDGKPVSASIFDFGLTLFHNAHELIRRGSGPYFYLPKLESHLEARLWNDIFIYAQNELRIARGTIKGTVLIETILAAFEMDEILYELREHSAGLNCGRWDYIFSFIKKFRSYPEYVLPDRGQVTMDRHFLKSYSELLIQTCHRRGAHAMGGMAAYIPIRSDASANELALRKVREDKLREVNAGHDGTWVAHPGLVPLATEIFNAGMPSSNQIERKQLLPNIKDADLLAVPGGTVSDRGIFANIRVSLIYLESWLRGQGCVPIDHLMEDAATAEISRTQLWQWVRHGLLEDRQYSEMISRMMRDLKATRPDADFAPAMEILNETTRGERFVDFVTVPAYDALDGGIKTDWRKIS